MGLKFRRYSILIKLAVFLFVAMLASGLLANTEVTIKEGKDGGGRRAYWNYDGETGFSWDHVLPYSQVKEAFIALMDQKAYFKSHTDLLDSIYKSLDPRGEPVKHVTDVTDEKVKRLVDVRKQIKLQRNKPGCKHDPISLSWESERDELLLTLLLYANGNGCYHMNGHGGVDPENNIDIRMLSPDSMTYVKNLNYPVHIIAGKAWCNLYKSIIDQQFIKAWDVKGPNMEVKSSPKMKYKSLLFPGIRARI